MPPTNLHASKAACQQLCRVQAKHHISSVDAQPSLSNGLIVFVTGQLLVRCWWSHAALPVRAEGFPCSMLTYQGCHRRKGRPTP